jgi:hypothetical protein
VINLFDRKSFATFQSSKADVGRSEDSRVGLRPRSGLLQMDAARQRAAIAYEIHVSRGEPGTDEGWKKELIVSSVRLGGMNGPWTLSIIVIVR